MSEAYDEFGFFGDNATEVGLPWSGPPVVARREVPVEGGRKLSALVWGSGPPAAVLLHGRAQNAHTWDTVGLALLAAGRDRSFSALDLPGHGHSGWKDDHDYRPAALAPDVLAAADALAPDARLLVGMSLGGLTSLALLGDTPKRFERLILVDITPGVNPGKGRAIAEFTSGPERFASFDEILERTVRYNPGRSESSLRRGVLHNAREFPDGSWSWRWDPGRPAVAAGSLAPLWDVLGGLSLPLTLVRGGASPVVDDDDVAELLRRRPDAEVVVVDGAGHSIQGDQPLELAELIGSRWPAG
jgi:pimeloyl-ACP methyl ester carboxylesterase